MFIAAILNLSNWIFLYYKIGEYSKFTVGDSSSEENNSDDDSDDSGPVIQMTIDKKRKILETVTYLVIMSLIGFFGWIYYNLFYLDKALNEIVRIFSGCLLLVIGLAFSIASFKINSRLKEYFYDFYIENRNLLLLPQIGLSAPMFIRGAYDLGRLYEPFNDFIIRHIGLADSLNFIIGDLIPISS